MQGDIRYTLVGDGPTDRCLRAVIDWTLVRDPSARGRGFIPQVADPRDESEPPQGLKERLRLAFQRFPCEVLFVHRDAEREPLTTRQEEIRRAAEQARIPLHVPVVPVRMTEAWLLIDERAIRRAADNPSGEEPLPIPPLKRLESVPDPKRLLHECLIAASEKRGRRRDQFKRSMSFRVQRVADLIDDFSPLLSLEAYRVLAEATGQAIAKLASPTA